MNQHPFTWAQPGQGFQRISSRDESNRDGRRRFRAHARRQGLQRLGPRQRMGGEGRGREAENLRTKGKPNPRPDFFHHAGAFHAKAWPRKAIHQHVFRQQSLRPHHIAEIQPRRAHAQPYLARAGFGQGADAIPAEARQLPRLANGQMCRKGGRCHGQARPQERRETPARGKADLRRVTAPFGQNAERGCLRRQTLRNHKSARLQPRHFIGEHPAKPNQRRRTGFLGLSHQHQPTCQAICRRCQRGHGRQRPGRVCHACQRQNIGATQGFRGRDFAQMQNGGPLTRPRPRGQGFRQGHGLGIGEDHTWPGAIPGDLRGLHRWVLARDQQCRPGGGLQRLNLRTLPDRHTKRGAPGGGIGQRAFRIIPPPGCVLP